MSRFTQDGKLVSKCPECLKTSEVGDLKALPSDEKEGEFDFYWTCPKCGKEIKVKEKELKFIRNKKDKEEKKEKKSLTMEQRITEWFSKGTSENKKEKEPTGGKVTMHNKNHYDLTELGNLSVMYEEMAKIVDGVNVTLGRWKFIENFLNLHKIEVPTEASYNWHECVRDLEKFAVDTATTIDKRYNELKERSVDLNYEIAQLYGDNYDGFTNLTSDFKKTFDDFVKASENN